MERPDGAGAKNYCVRITASNVRKERMPQQRASRPSKTQWGLRAPTFNSKRC